MAVRSLNSLVFRWPDAHTVDQAVRRWAQEVSRHRTDILRIGYKGSYARGDWGVGSDLNLIVIVERGQQPFWRCAVGWDLASLTVPADVLVYTEEEWRALAARGARFCRVVEQEAVWVYVRGEATPLRPEEVT